MENKDKKIGTAIKIIGAGLLFLAIPGSTLALPWLIQKIKNNNKKEESNPILGI